MLRAQDGEGAAGQRADRHAAPSTWTRVDANTYSPNKFERGDWTVGKDGQKYGIDQQYIRLGRFQIPTALLALLPINQHAGEPDQRWIATATRPTCAPTSCHAQARDERGAVPEGSAAHPRPEGARAAQITHGAGSRPGAAQLYGAGGETAASRRLIRQSRGLQSPSDPFPRGTAG